MKRLVYFALFLSIGFMACTSSNENGNGESVPEEPVFSMVEEMPRFLAPECEKLTGNDRQGCANIKMLEYVRGNLKYPESAKEKGMEGQAVIGFNIEKDGSVSKMEIIRDPGEGMGEEAKRIVASFPKFIPGKQKGEVVIVRYNMPVKFKLN